MKCSKCGVPLKYVLTGNIIDWIRHPENCSEVTQPVIKTSDSWEPAARHYRNIEPKVVA
jgi:hypothetical protein